MAGFGSSWLPMMTDPYAVQAQTAQNPATQLPPGWMATPEAQALADAELRKKQGLMGPPQPPAKPKMAPTPPPSQPRQLTGPDPSTTDITARSDYDELVARLNAKGLDSLQQQQGGLDALRQKIALQLQHSSPQLDLTPLLALTDTWSGSNLAQSYQRPGFEKNQETVRQLEGALRQGQNAMSDNEIGLLRSQLGIEESKLARADRAQQRQDDLAWKKQQAAQSAAERELRRQELDDHRIEQDVQKLGKLSGDTAPIIGKLQAVDGLLNKYSKGKDIPGVGANDAWKPDLFVSEDGTNLRQMVGSIQSDVIRMYSGSAASEGEVRRIANALGNKLSQGDEQFRFGMQELSNAIARAQADREAAFRPEVRERYQGRGGVSSESLKGLNYGAQPQQQKPSGSSDPYKMSDTELDAELSRLKGGK